MADNPQPQPQPEQIGLQPGQNNVGAPANPIPIVQGAQQAVQVIGPSFTALKTIPVVDFLLSVDSNSMSANQNPPSTASGQAAQAGFRAMPSSAVKIGYVIPFPEMAVGSTGQTFDGMQDPTAFFVVVSKNPSLKSVFLKYASVSGSQRNHAGLNANGISEGDTLQITESDSMSVLVMAPHLVDSFKPCLLGDSQRLGSTLTSFGPSPEDANKTQSFKERQAHASNLALRLLLRPDPLSDADSQLASRLGPKMNPSDPFAFSHFTSNLTRGSSAASSLVAHNIINASLFMGFSFVISIPTINEKTGVASHLHPILLSGPESNYGKNRTFRDLQYDVTVLADLFQACFGVDPADSITVFGGLTSMLAHSPVLARMRMQVLDREFAMLCSRLTVTLFSKEAASLHRPALLTLMATAASSFDVGGCTVENTLKAPPVQGEHFDSYPVVGVKRPAPAPGQTRDQRPKLSPRGGGGRGKGGAAPAPAPPGGYLKTQPCHVDTSHLLQLPNSSACSIDSSLVLLSARVGSASHRGSEMCYGSSFVRTPPFLVASATGQGGRLFILCTLNVVKINNSSPCNDRLPCFDRLFVRPNTPPPSSRPRQVKEALRSSPPPSLRPQQVGRCRTTRLPRVPHSEPRRKGSRTTTAL